MPFLYYLFYRRFHWLVEFQTDELRPAEVALLPEEQVRLNERLTYEHPRRLAVLAGPSPSAGSSGAPSAGLEVPDATPEAPTEPSNGIGASRASESLGGEGRPSNGSEPPSAAPAARSWFEPKFVIPIAAQNVGKTSFLSVGLGLVGPRQPDGTHVRPGTEPLHVMPSEGLLQRRPILLKSWRRGDPSHTDGLSHFDTEVMQGRFEPAVAMGLHFVDSNGHTHEPGHLPPDLLQQIVGAAGLVFGLDATCFDPARTLPTDEYEERCDLLRFQSDYWAELVRKVALQRPDVYHLPVAELLNKADQLLGEEAALFIDRPLLLPEDPLPILEMTVRSGAPHSLVSGLRACLARRKRNNHSVLLQRVLDDLLTHARSFFEAVLRRTHRLQIALAVSCAKPQHGLSPFGAREVCGWMERTLYRAWAGQANQQLTQRVETVAGKLREIEERLSRLRSIDTKLREGVSWSEHVAGKLALAPKDAEERLRSEQNTLRQEIADALAEAGQQLSFHLPPAELPVPRAGTVVRTFIEDVTSTCKLVQNALLEVDIRAAPLKNTARSEAISPGISRQKDCKS